NTVLLAVTWILFLANGSSFSVLVSKLGPRDLIPGTLGILLVAGIPFVMSRFGAVQVFIPLIVSQIFGSLAWDCFLEGREVTLMKLIGSFVALSGVVLVSI